MKKTTMKKTRRKMTSTACLEMTKLKAVIKKIRKKTKSSKINPYLK